MCPKLDHQLRTFSGFLLYGLQTCSWRKTIRRCNELVDISRDFSGFNLFESRSKPYLPNVRSQYTIHTVAGPAGAGSHHDSSRQHHQLHLPAASAHLCQPALLRHTHLAHRIWISHHPGKKPDLICHYFSFSIIGPFVPALVLGPKPFTCFYVCPPMA